MRDVLDSSAVTEQIRSWCTLPKKKCYLLCDSIFPTQHVSKLTVEKADNHCDNRTSCWMEVESRSSKRLPRLLAETGLRKRTGAPRDAGERLRSLERIQPNPAGKAGLQ